MAAYNYNPDLWRKLLSGEYYNKNITSYTKTLSQYYNDIVNNTQQEKTEPALVQNTIDNVYKTGKTIYDANKVNFWSNRASNLMQRADKAKNAFDFTKAANLADRAEKASQRAINIGNNTQKGLNTATKASSIASKISGWAGAALTAGSFAADMYLASKSRYNQNNVGLYDQPTTINDLNNFNLQTIDRSGFNPVNRKKAPWIVLDKAASGASAGAFKGGVGAAIGTAIGTVAGLGQLGLQSQRFDRDMALADQADYISRNVYNTKYNNTISDANNKYNTITNRQLNRHIAANGGFINSNDNMKYAEGGQIENVFNNGGTHEENEYGGIHQGFDSEGNEQLAEQNEVRIDDFIYSARIVADKDILAKFNCAVKRENATYAEIAQQILDNFNERKDYISNKTKRILFERLAQAQEYQKVSEEAAKYGMAPEEYMEYQQQLQEQQAMQEQYQQEVPEDYQQQMDMQSIQQPFYEDEMPQQFAFGGRLFAEGGDTGEPSRPPYTDAEIEKILLNRQKTGGQRLQEYLWQEFPKLQEYRKEIHDVIKDVASGIDGDNALAYELVFSSLNDLLFGTTDEEAENAKYAIAPPSASGANIGGKIFSKLGNKFTTKILPKLKKIVKSVKPSQRHVVNYGSTVGSGLGLSNNATLQKTSKALQKNPTGYISTNKGMDAFKKMTIAQKKQFIENFDKGVYFTKPYKNLNASEKLLYSELKKLSDAYKANPNIFNTSKGVDAWRRISQIIKSPAIGGTILTNGILTGAIYGLNKHGEIQDQNSNADIAIQNITNYTPEEATRNYNREFYSTAKDTIPQQTEQNVQTNTGNTYDNSQMSVAYDLPTDIEANRQSVNNSNYIPNVYGASYGSTQTSPALRKYSFQSHITYEEPGLRDFVLQRERSNIVEDFTNYYNDATGKQYTPEQIYKNLSDHNWKDIHEAFYNWINQNVEDDTKPIDNLEQYFNPIIDQTDDGNVDSDVSTEPTKYYGQDPDVNPEPTTNPNNRNTDWLDGLYDLGRAVPTLNKLRGIFEQEEPDGAYANEILSYYRPTDYNPTGRYKTYSPADQYMLMRQARAQRNALAQQYLANSAGNPAVANYMLAANDAQYNNDLADNYLKIKEYNDLQRNQTLEYNNALDEANEVRRENIQQANNQLWANLGIPAAAAREQERRDVEEAKYANRESFWDDIAEIIRERQNRKLIERNPVTFYDSYMRYKG